MMMNHSLRRWARERRRLWRSGCSGARRSTHAGFGSFFSDPLEALVRDPKLDDADALHAELLEPHQRDLLADPLTESPEFMLQDPAKYLNAGSFGACLQGPFYTANAWRRIAEDDPVRMVDRTLMPALAHSVRQLARLLHVSPTDLVLTENATSALNAVIAHASQTCSRAVLLDISYGSVKQMARHYFGAERVAVCAVPLSADTADPDELENLVVNALRTELVAPPGDSRPPLVVVDFTTSNTALNVPLGRIVPAAHESGAQVLVDGAHALGAAPELDVSAIGADYFAGNAHKWFGNPRGAGFLYVSPTLQGPRPLPRVVSHGLGSGFASEHLWRGATDYAPLLALPRTVSIHREHFGDRVLRDMAASSRAAAMAVAQVLGTEDDFVTPLSWHGPMALVPLPPVSRLRHASSADELQNRLFHAHGFEVPVKRIGQRLFLRLSVHAYNEPSHYQALATAIVQDCM